MQSNPARHTPARRRPVAAWGLLCILLGLFVVFPPVRFRRYQAGSSAIAGAVQPQAAAQQFWDDHLLPAARKASDAKVVVEAIRADRAAAVKKYATTPAVGGPSFFFIAGSGTVIAKSKSQTELSIAGDGKADIVIETGPLFGNAVRDGTGLLNPSEYPNSGDYNALSAELNKLVQDRVLPTLRERAEVGSHIRFAGVAEIAEDEASPLPIQVIPISLEIQ